MANIIQWNCQGLKICLLVLTLLVQSFLPIAFCLQETHLKESDNVSLKGYNMYSTFSKVDERAAGGSSIFVKDNVIHSTVKLTTGLQAVAIRLSLASKVANSRLCNSRLPEEHFVGYQMSQHNWVTIKVHYGYLRKCLLGWHKSRLGFVTSYDGEVSLGPLGKTSS